MTDSVTANVAELKPANKSSSLINKIPADELAEITKGIDVKTYIEMRENDHTHAFVMGVFDQPKNSNPVLKKVYMTYLVVQEMHREGLTDEAPYTNNDIADYTSSAFEMPLDAAKKLTLLTTPHLVDAGLMLKLPHVEGKATLYYTEKSKQAMLEREEAARKAKEHSKG